MPDAALPGLALRAVLADDKSEATREERDYGARSARVRRGAGHGVGRRASLADKSLTAFQVEDVGDVLVLHNLVHDPPDEGGHGAAQMLCERNGGWR